jgi:hypothetical protein
MRPDLQLGGSAFGHASTVTMNMTGEPAFPPQWRGRVPMGPGQHSYGGPGRAPRRGTTAPSPALPPPLPISEATATAILRELRVIKVAAVIIVIGILVLLAVIASIGTGIANEISTIQSQSLASHTSIA